MWEEEEGKSEEEIKLIKERCSFDAIECVSCKHIIHKSKDGLMGSGDANKFHIGYGSIHDGSVLMIGLCDVCISEKLENGNIYYIEDSFLHGEMFKDRTDRWDDIRKSKLRDLNINKLT